MQRWIRKKTLVFAVMAMVIMTGVSVYNTFFGVVVMEKGLPFKFSMPRYGLRILELPTSNQSVPFALVRGNEAVVYSRKDDDLAWVLTHFPCKKERFGNADCYIHTQGKNVNILVWIPPYQREAGYFLEFSTARKGKVWNSIQESFQLKTDQSHPRRI